MNSPPPLPVPTPSSRVLRIPQRRSSELIGTIVRLVLQLVLCIPSLVILPFLSFGLGIPAIVEALHGNHLAQIPATIGVFYPLGLLLVAISIFIPTTLRLRMIPCLLPLLGAVLFATSAYLLYTKAHWGGDPTQPHRKEMEILGMSGGTILVGAWNALRCVKSLIMHSIKVA